MSNWVTGLASSWEASSEPLVYCPAWPVLLVPLGFSICRDGWEDDIFATRMLVVERTLHCMQREEASLGLNRRASIRTGRSDIIYDFKVLWCLSKWYRNDCDRSHVTLVDDLSELSKSSGKWISAESAFHPDFISTFACHVSSSRRLQTMQKRQPYHGIRACERPYSSLATSPSTFATYRRDDPPRASEATSTTPPAQLSRSYAE